MHVSPLNFGFWIVEFGFKVRLRRINLIKVTEQSDTTNLQPKIQNLKLPQKLKA